MSVRFFKLQLVYQKFDVLPEHTESINIKIFFKRCTGSGKHKIVNNTFLSFISQKIKMNYPSIRYIIFIVYKIKERDVSFTILYLLFAVWHIVIN